MLTSADYPSAVVLSADTSRDNPIILCCLGRSARMEQSLDCGYECSFSTETEVCPRKTTRARKRCSVSRGRTLTGLSESACGAVRVDHVVRGKTLRGFPLRCASRRVARPASRRRSSDTWVSVLWSRCSCAAVFVGCTSARRSKPPLESGRTSASIIEFGCSINAIDDPPILRYLFGLFNSFVEYIVVLAVECLQLNRRTVRATDTYLIGSIDDTRAVRCSLPVTQ